MNIILAKAFTPMVYLIFFGAAPFIPQAVGQNKRPEVLPVSTRVYDQLRGRSFDWPIKNKKPGARIDSGFLVGNSGWIIFNVSMQHVFKLPNGKEVWGRTNARVFAINRNNGSVSQVAIDDQGKNNLLITSNFTMLEKNVVGISVEPQPKTPSLVALPPWHKETAQLYAWDLEHKSIKLIDDSYNKYSAMTLGVFDRNKFAPVIENNILTIVDKTKKTKLRLHSASDDPPITRPDLYMEPVGSHADYFVRTADGIVICNNNDFDHEKITIDHVAFDSKKNWSINSSLIKSKTGDESFLDLVYPVYGSEKTSNKLYFALEFWDSSWKIAVVNSKTGVIDRVLATKFQNMHSGMPVISSGERWLVAMGSWDEDDGVILFELQSGKSIFKSLSYNVNELELIGVTDDGHIIASRFNAIVMIFPESDFAERTLFELWPAKTAK